MDKPRKYPCASSGPDPPDGICPWCYENLKGRSSHEGHRYRSLRPFSILFPIGAFMKRPDASQVSKKGSWSCPDPSFFKSYPLLAAGLCDPWWDDGKPRQVWTITLSFDGPNANVCVNDKELGQGSYTTAASLQEALALIEGALKANTLSWRRWKK